MDARHVSFHGGQVESGSPTPYVGHLESCTTKQCLSHLRQHKHDDHGAAFLDDTLCSMYQFIVKYN